MTTLSLSQANLSRAHTKGVLRNAYERLVEARHLQARRYLSSLSVHGHDRSDLADLDRRSMFDVATRERS